MLWEFWLRFSFQKKFIGQLCFGRSATINEKRSKRKNEKRKKFEKKLLFGVWTKGVHCLNLETWTLSAYPPSTYNLILHAQRCLGVNWGEKRTTIVICWPLKNLRECLSLFRPEDSIAPKLSPSSYQASIIRPSMEKRDMWVSNNFDQIKAFQDGHEIRRAVCFIVWHVIMKFPSIIIVLLTVTTLSIKTYDDPLEISQALSVADSVERDEDKVFSPDPWMSLSLKFSH